MRKKRQIKIEFWSIADLMVHLEYDLYFLPIHSLLLLRNENNKQYKT